MRLRLLLMIAFALTSTALAVAPAVATEPEVPWGSEAARTAHAAEEMAKFEWAAVAGEERERWTIVRIEPGDGSGGGILTEKPVRAASGKIVYVPDDILVAFHGRWSLVSRWSEEGMPIPKEGKFAWSDPEPHYGIRQSKPDGLHAPLTDKKPSPMLVRWIDGRRPKPGQLLGSMTWNRPWDRLVFIPPGWEAAFSEAWKRQDAVNAVLAAKEPDWNAVKRLALDPNGPVALAAVQRLQAAKQLDAAVAKEVLAHAHGTNLAILMYVVTLDMPEAEAEILQKELVKLASQAIDAADARGWGAGALATAHFAWSARPQALLGRAVLASAKRRGVALGLDPEANLDFFKLRPGPTEALPWEELERFEAELEKLTAK